MLGELGRRLLMLLHRRRFDADLDEEMRLHRELCEQAEIERGRGDREPPPGAAKKRVVKSPSVVPRRAGPTAPPRVVLKPAVVTTLKRYMYPRTLGTMQKLP